MVLTGLNISSYRLAVVVPTLASANGETRYPADVDICRAQQTVSSLPGTIAFELVSMAIKRHRKTTIRSTVTLCLSTGYVTLFTCGLPFYLLLFIVSIKTTH